MGVGVRPILKRMLSLVRLGIGRSERAADRPAVRPAAGREKKTSKSERPGDKRTKSDPLPVKSWTAENWGKRPRSVLASGVGFYTVTKRVSVTALRTRQKINGRETFKWSLGGGEGFTGSEETIGSGGA